MNNVDNNFLSRGIVVEEVVLEREVVVEGVTETGIETGIGVIEIGSVTETESMEAVGVVEVAEVEEVMGKTMGISVTTTSETSE